MKSWQTQGRILEPRGMREGQAGTEGLQCCCGDSWWEGKGAHYPVVGFLYACVAISFFFFFFSILLVCLFICTCLRHIMVTLVLGVYHVHNRAACYIFPFCFHPPSLPPALGSLPICKPFPSSLLPIFYFVLYLLYLYILSSS